MLRAKIKQVTYLPHKLQFTLEPPFNNHYHKSVVHRFNLTHRFSNTRLFHRFKVTSVLQRLINFGKLLTSTEQNTNSFCIT